MFYFLVSSLKNGQKLISVDDDLTNLCFAVNIKSNEIAANGKVKFSNRNTFYIFAIGQLFVIYKFCQNSSINILKIKIYGCMLMQLKRNVS